jgi:glycosyltransferase involved in cell wall biosynthesis
VRILLLTQVVPNPPDSGPKIKTHNVLRYLVQRHEVHLVSFSRSDAEDKHARALSRYCASVSTVRLARSRQRDALALLRSFVTNRSFLVERDDSPALRQTLRDLTRTHAFDAVHADQLTMAQFALDLPVRPKVLDEHNAVWTIVRRLATTQPRWQRPLAELEWRKLRAYEGRVCRAFDRVTVVSPDDRAALEEAAGGRFAATTIPIAVDTADLAFAPRSPTARDVVSVATMFYPPNVEGIYWFATEAFPIVRKEAPDVTFRIVGARPPAHVVGLARPGSGIEVTGYVADLEPTLARSAVLVVPLHSGSGMRVKILEAFARGIPVVSTTIGVEGIDARADEHLLVADDAVSFAREVLRLLEDPALAARIARAGRRLVEERYDWRRALTGLDEIYPR